MTQRSNVLPNVAPPTETDYRNAWLQAVARLCANHGEDRVAQWLGITVRHLQRNIRSGVSLPGPDKLWGLLAFDPSAHDEMDALYGLRHVPVDALCSTDPLTRDLIALANEVAQSEDPNSPGGVAVTDHELLDKDEHRMRRVYNTLGVWLERIGSMRRPRSVA
ncbi:hypothetical protein [Sphingobium yanoikuyae]|uniref:hypothetical protein n=1 Tax=Sphingobium yanoikuyae TaxID=13690 RepID=UPI0026EDB7B4|nr:hypothetical protein [Sphingobium yanoikuyae]